MSKSNINIELNIVVIESDPDINALVKVHGPKMKVTGFI